jgi:hypothetical protein
MAFLWLKSPGGSPPFGADGCFAQLWCRGGGPHGIFTVRPELLVTFSGEWAA